MSTITSSLTSALSVEAADIDGDGDNDVIAASYSGGQIWYYEYVDDDDWEAHLVASEISHPICVAAGDLDNDGDKDIASISLINGSAYWFEYDVFGWTTHTLATSFPGGHRLKICDLNDDGWGEIIASSDEEGFVIFENDMDGTFTRTTLSASNGTPYGIDFGDVDYDGDLDVVGCDYSSDAIFWWENTGTSWSAHSIATNVDSPLDISFGDMDGDFDGDVCVCFDTNNKVAWFENNGDSNWTQHVVTSDFLDASDVIVCDLDNDSDMDIVSCSYLDGTVAFWENESGDFEQNVIADDYSNAWSIAVGDLDQDNDLDIISSSYWSGRINWWAQPGLGFPVTLSLRTFEWPIVIPANGGDFLYAFHLTNATGMTFSNAHFWNAAIMPDGTEIGPLNVLNGTIFPYMDIEVWNLQQMVPASAPTGEYTYIARIGYFQVYAEGNFRITKLPPDNPADAVTENPSWEDWTLSPFTLTGFEQGTAAEAGLPGSFKLLPVTPNPFNAATTVRVELSQPGELELNVFNVNGQLVTTLAEGSYSAGLHPFSFNASTLASGVYFVHASVAGDAQQVQKVMLLR